MSLYPFTERYAQPYFFSCFIRQTFKTLCFLNYALMIRHDYDLTSSLRRGALQWNWKVVLAADLDDGGSGRFGGFVGFVTVLLLMTINDGGATEGGDTLGGGGWWCSLWRR
nr:hypothetical protein [Tanacetum cinerariifolium]